jgi:Glycosyl hydrolases family 43
VGDPRRRWRVVIAVTVVGLLVWGAVTDLQVHARSRHEHRELVAARAALASTRSELRATSSQRALASSQEDALQDSVSLSLQLMGTTEQALDRVNSSTYLEGVDIGHLQTCLGGVQQAYQQIGVNNNSLAVSDLSGVSTACLTADGGSADGQVYPFDFPDPFVLRVGNVYFAYATNSAGGNIQIIESSDLRHWSALGNALPNLPKWAQSGETWAPSVQQVGSTYVLYYSATMRGSGELCISAAVATQPQGPFVDTSAGPLTCQPSLGGSIDPSPFTDVNGASYLEWKTNGAAGHPAQIWSQRLDATGTALSGPGPNLLLSADQSWEGGVVEAPDLVVNAGRYFLFYSGNDWDTVDYAVGVASCRGPLGPCAEPWTKPILASDAHELGTGGETVFTDSSGSPWIAFHAWLPNEVGYPHSRELYLRRLRLTGPEPVVEAAS